ncbi:MAG TPA: hypothetical protein VNH18_15050, partial [Bryobacteraceae bacterium]|nr:hypothetical protein [Bryobacteraceae bacterium]
ATALEADLRPSGMLEITFAAEILRATWRLQRLPVEFMDLDQPASAHIARLRSGIQTTLRWAMTELRRIQTARVLRGELGIPNSIGLADPKEILKAGRNPKPAAQQPPPPIELRPAPAAKPARPDPVNLHQMEAMFEAILDRAERKEMAAPKEPTQNRPDDPAIGVGGGFRDAA